MLTQADLSNKHPMTDAIVAALRSAGVVVSLVEDNTITTELGVFSVRRGIDPGRGGATNRRANVFSKKAELGVNFPDGPKMTSTIKKFVAEVRAKCVNIDAQMERKAMLHIISNGLRSDMDVSANYLDAHNGLVGQTCMLRLRSVPLDKAADIAAQIATLLTANGIG